MRSGRFFTPGDISPGRRTVTREGGRDGDVFFGNRGHACPGELVGSRPQRRGW
nr:hypothetical protein [Nocardia cyriacigeorgica]